MMHSITIINTIARAARQQLGRTTRSTGGVDWQAVEAIRSAAAEQGMGGMLLRWVPTTSTSMRGLAEAYVTRYIQAYGASGSMIDMGAHIGAGTPILVTVAA